MIVKKQIEKIISWFRTASSLYPCALLFLMPYLHAESASDNSDWLKAKGEFRLRYESLDGQFRAGLDGSDQILAARTLAQLSASFNTVVFNAELQDSRVYLDDEGTPLSTSFVNTFEFINLNVDFDLGSLLGRQSETKLKVGRQTIEVGSERFIERNGFRNTINSYDGIHLRNYLNNKNSFEAFVVSPVRAQPRPVLELSENKQRLDKTDDAIVFWGVLYSDNKNWLKNTTTELFAYGLNESDKLDRATSDREIYTLGFRTIKDPEIEVWDFEVEYAYQFGKRFSSSSTQEQPLLDVQAETLHAELAYTFPFRWQPRLAFELDFASGDDDPNDGRFGSYDRLFGSRRGDVGFTSIHGPLVRNNLVLAGFDLDFQFTPTTDGFISIQRAWLDSATDELDAANLRDSNGESGTLIGDTLDVRLRHWFIAKKIRVDIGASALFNGQFLNEVPDGPSQNRTLYGFTQLVAKF